MQLHVGALVRNGDGCDVGGNVDISIDIYRGGGAVEARLNEEIEQDYDHEKTENGTEKIEHRLHPWGDGFCITIGVRKQELSYYSPCSK